MNPSDYLLPKPDINWTAALVEWGWLLPPKCIPICVTCFGDVFLTAESGVYLLDLEEAAFDRYCETESSLLRTLSQDDDADVLLYSSLVDRLRCVGLSIDPLRCYHFKMPTILGGEVDVDNVGTNTIDERVRFCGDLHRQIKDLPDGTPVRFRVTDS
ncbi:T6SS immunity protein Tdi1 domain-containing protein [Allorhodopirellula solitaria]|nr:T6SS immunity protein Tdi1 domain-containing protein [Allorhodopirellula solitaria]